MTIAQAIIADARTKTYPYTHVLHQCIDRRTVLIRDQVGLVDTYVFEDGSKISFPIVVSDK